MLLAYVPPHSDVSEGAAQLIHIFRSAGCRASTILIGSEDTELVAEIITNALSKLGKNEIKGCQVIVVVSESSRKYIKNAFKDSGAKLFLSTYSPPN